MTTRRVRAGQPVPDCGASGCNGPIEGECLGFCTRRVEAWQIEQRKPVGDLPIQMVEPELSLRDRFLKLLGEWK